MSLQLHPITISDACLLVKRLHRHHAPPQGALFAIGVAQVGSDEPCGCAIVGRPVARRSDDGWTAEVTRLATDGSRNACSMLYRACWRAALAMGYRRLITYTLETEGGASLAGAGFTCLGQRGGGSWSREERPRVDKHPLQKKITLGTRRMNRRALLSLLASLPFCGWLRGKVYRDTWPTPAPKWVVKSSKLILVHGRIVCPSNPTISIIPTDAEPVA